MSNKVDQRIVEMRFENSQFEKGVSQSINSLDKLKASLNFDNSISKSSISSLSGNLNDLTSSVDKVSDRFSNLGVIGLGALMSIGEAAVDVGRSMVENLLSNITSGYERYEEMMTSIQTIMYATRNEWEDQEAQMEYVNGQIDRLNWFTDETSYNLSDMTSNVGKFISAGIPLKDAVTNMMGIASWAAISGQNAQAASRAMYNLSQAMATGKMTLLDWRSIENVNMNTREFMNTAIQCGVALGTLWEGADGLIYGFDQYGHEIEVSADTFRSSLAGGWLDRDVLSATLDEYGRFSNDMAAYTDALGMETNEMIEYMNEALERGLGDLDDWDPEEHLQAIEIIEDIGHKAGIAEGDMELWSEAITQFTAHANDLGRAAFLAGQESKTLTDSLNYTADAVQTGWANIFQNILGDYLRSKELFTAFSDILYDQMVKPIEDLEEMFEEVNNIGGFEKLKEALLNFYEVFKNIQTAIKEGFGEVFGQNTSKLMLYFFQNLEEASEKLKALFHNFIDVPYYSDFNNIKDAAESVAIVLNRFSINLGVIKKSISDAWSAIFPKKDIPWLDSLTEKIKDIADAFEKMTKKFVLGSEEADKLTRTFKGVFAILDMIKMAIVAFLKPLGVFNFEIGEMSGSILDATAEWGDWVVAWHDWMQETGFFDQVAAKVYEFFGNIPVWADKATMALFGMHLNEFFDTIAGDIGLAIGAIVLFFTDLPENAQKAFEFITGEKDFLTWWDKIKEKVQGAWDTLQEFFNNLPQKMDDISQALFGSDWATVWAEIQTGVFNAYQDIAKFFGFIEEYDEKGFKKNSPFKQMLMDLEEMWDELMRKIDELKQKLEPVGDWLIENVFSQEGMEEAGKVLKNAGIIGSISLILFLLWKAFAQLKEIIGFVRDIKGSKTSNKGLFGKLSELLGPAKWLRNLADDTEAMAGNFAKLLKGGYFALIGLLVVELAAALMIVSKCMTDNPGQTLAAFGMLLLMFGAIVGTGIYMMRKLPANDMKNMGECFALMGFVFVEIAAALWILQDIPIDQMITSVIALGAFFVAMAFAVGYFAKQPAMEANLMQIAVAFDLMAASIVILAFAMYILKDLNLEQALIALGSIIILMAALFGFALLIDKFKVGDGLQALSIGFIALGVGILFMGAAMLLAGVGINIAADGISKIVDALVQLGDSMATPQQLGDAFVQFFVGIAQSIGENREALTQGLTDLWMIFVDTFRNVAPEILANLQMFLLQFLDMLTTVWPRIEEFLLMAGNTALLLLGQLVSGLLDILVANGPKVLELLRFLGQSILILVEEFTPQITTVAFNLLLDTLNQILENIGEITMLATAIGIEIILGLIDGIAEEFDDVIDSGVNLILKLIDGIGQGIEDHAGELREKLDSFVEHLKNGLKEFLGLDKGASDGELYNIAVQAVADFLRGIADMGPNIWQAGLDVAKAFISGTQSQEGLDEHSPSKAMEKVGEYAMDGLVNGLDNKTAAVAEGARKAGQTALKGMTKIASDISKRIDDIVNGWTPPTITPVLDLSEVTSGASDLASIFNDQTYGLDLAGTTGFEINKSSSNVNSLFDNLTDFMSAQATNNPEALTQNIVFNIDGAKDPKVVADEVSTILQNQIDRRNAVWV